MADDGNIFIRTADDAFRVCYPHNEVLQEIVELTNSSPNSSARFHARKLYSYLIEAGYKNIEMKNFLVDTANKTLDEKKDMFLSSFSYRKDYFLRQLKQYNTQDEQELLIQNNNRMNELLNIMKQDFLLPEFYFGYDITIVTAKKGTQNILHP